eukprot:TRINITY_DN31094_c0_g1_i1.p1 TRINITY_DN31094_c0_g1~~TRINITY_DN31094_c0_g1_i1.p1  ORF type:complete len:377 (-),score=67.15 TRINITY_DN31094_c0_g1_i1:17-1120(-)
MALREEAGWHAAHGEHFGDERWEELCISMQRDPEHLCYLNPFIPLAEQDVIKRDYCLEETNVPGAYHFRLPEEPESQFAVVDSSDDRALFVSPVRALRDDVEVLGAHPSEALAPLHFAEGAMLIIATALQVEEGEMILDGSAFPGTTGLVLAGCNFACRCPRGEPMPHDIQGRIVLNEVNKQKAAKLQETMRLLLPASLFDPGSGCGSQQGPRIIFTSCDIGTTTNSVEKNGPYDKILLGPPCTDDRRLLRGVNGGLTRWSAATSKVSVERQVKWLYNALWLLRDGGMLLFYSVALHPEECDGAIEKLLMKARGKFELEVLPLEESICRIIPGLHGESTGWGTRIMPDKTTFGPLFFSRIRLIKRML